MCEKNEQIFPLHPPELSPEPESKEPENYRYKGSQETGSVDLHMSLTALVELPSFLKQDTGARFPFHLGKRDRSLVGKNSRTIE